MQMANYQWLRFFKHEFGVIDIFMLLHAITLLKHLILRTKKYMGKKNFFVAIKSRRKMVLMQEKCYTCGRQFSNTNRVDLEEFWHLYSSGKQTYVQLAELFAVLQKLFSAGLIKYLLLSEKSFPV